MTYITIKENDLKIKANPLRLKIIAEALSEYMWKHAIFDTTLSDFRFKMEKEYQEHHKLNRDDWDYTKKDYKKIVYKSETKTGDNNNESN